LARCSEEFAEWAIDVNPGVAGGMVINLIGAIPLYKPWLGLPVAMGASKFTNVRGFSGFQFPIPESAYLDEPFSLFGESATVHDFVAAGRINTVTGIGTALFSGTAILKCTYACLDEGLQ
jgi:hypothetical protein